MVEIVHFWDKNAVFLFSRDEIDINQSCKWKKKSCMKKNETKMNDTIQIISQYLNNNKEWLFSGAGVSVISFVIISIVKYLHRKKSTKINENDNEVSKQEDFSNKPEESSKKA